MNKRLGHFSLVFTVAALFAMISWGNVLQAQQTDPQQPTTPQTQQPQQPPDTQAPATQPQKTPQTPDQAQPTQSATSDSNGSTEFVGTVVKQGDKYVFQDSASGATFDIDHQDDVKKFEGKRVRVQGTLDPNTKTIHVR